MAFALRASGFFQKGAAMAPHSPPDPAVALNLALAVVASSVAPLLLLDKDLHVVAASTSFCKAFQIDPDKATGCALAALGDGEWKLPQLSSLLKATAAGFAQVEGYEMNLVRRDRENRCLVLNAKKLDYAADADIRLVLSVADVTDARLAEKLKISLLKEKDVLLQELHHRVANSLQIIASVLMVSARKVQSEETRGHLHDAHHRVMSIAAVQQQLAMTTASEVELGSYLTKLCQSLGASMIYDHKTLKLEVNTDDSSVDATDSVSLGLIVTELVINALKHAFPRHHAGKIVVDYRSDAGDWTLSVSDNGVGMPAKPAVKAGLGTSIVKALASRLQADIQTTDTNPGTMISIVHLKSSMTAAE
jgi:two-component system, sensor histidine kinase PdtaS